MQGIEDNKFGPEENLTRGMLVTVLWRMEGEPNTDYKVTFKIRIMLIIQTQFVGLPKII